MALSFTWNDAFENRPGPNLAVNQLDNELRFLREAVRQVMSREHNVGPGTPDDGKHRAGYITLFDVGDEAYRDTLTDIPEGALYLLYAGGNYYVQVYDGIGWASVTTVDHADLLNLDGNPHPELLLKSGGTLVRGINLGSNTLAVATTGKDFGGKLTTEHLDDPGHPVDFIASATGITDAHFEYEDKSVSLALDLGGPSHHNIEIPQPNFPVSKYIRVLSVSMTNTDTENMCIFQWHDDQLLAHCYRQWKGNTGSSYTTLRLRPSYGTNVALTVRFFRRFS